MTRTAWLPAGLPSRPGPALPCPWVRVLELETGYEEARPPHLALSFCNRCTPLFCPSPHSLPRTRPKTEPRPPPLLPRSPGCLESPGFPGNSQVSLVSTQPHQLGATGQSLNAQRFQKRWFQQEKTHTEEAGCETRLPDQQWDLLPSRGAPGLALIGHRVVLWVLTPEAQEWQGPGRGGHRQRPCKAAG